MGSPAPTALPVEVVSANLRRVAARSNLWIDRVISS